MLGRVTRALFLFAIVLAVSGCAATINRGVRAEPPARTGRLFRSASTKEAHGLLVLLNGQTSGLDFHTRTWSATDEVELEVLWRGVRPGGSPPGVDFNRYVVLGVAYEGGVCQPPILGIESEPSGLLGLRYDPDRLLDTCIMVAVRVAHVVAVPRRVLPGPVVYLWDHRFVLDDMTGDVAER